MYREYESEFKKINLSGVTPQILNEKQSVNDQNIELAMNNACWIPVGSGAPGKTFVFSLSCTESARVFVEDVAPYIKKFGGTNVCYFVNALRNTHDAYYWLMYSQIRPEFRGKYLAKHFSLLNKTSSVKSIRKEIVYKVLSQLTSSEQLGLNEINPTVVVSGAIMFSVALRENYKISSTPFFSYIE